MSFKLRERAVSEVLEFPGPADEQNGIAWRHFRSARQWATNSSGLRGDFPQNQTFDGGREAEKVNTVFLRWRVATPAVMLGLLFLAWALPGQAGQPVQTGRIGVVDMQMILNQSERGKAAKQKLDQERDARQKELDARQQEVMKMQADLEKQAPVLSEQAKREKGEALQRRVRDIRRIAEDSNRDFEKRLAETEADMTREIIKVVQEYGKDQGYVIILERSTLPYVAPTADVTGEVIKRFDGSGKPK